MKTLYNSGFATYLSKLSYQILDIWPAQAWWTLRWWRCHWSPDEQQGYLAGSALDLQPVWRAADIMKGCVMHEAAYSSGHAPWCGRCQPPQWNRTGWEWGQETCIVPGVTSAAQQLPQTQHRAAEVGGKERKGGKCEGEPEVREGKGEGGEWR